LEYHLFELEQLRHPFFKFLLVMTFFVVLPLFLAGSTQLLVFLNAVSMLQNIATKLAASNAID
jgi:hypothetical protein